MRRYLLACLTEICWREEQHRTSLRGGRRFVEAIGGEFFDLTYSQLLTAFAVLHVESIVSSVVFIVQLTVNCLCKPR